MTRNSKLRILLITAVLVLGAVLTGCGTQKDAEDQTDRTTETKISESSVDKQDHQSDDPVSTLLFASDYQEEPGWPLPEENLRAILGAVSSNGKTPDKLIYCGDYTNDRKLYDYQVSPEDSISRIREVAAETFTELTENDMLFVQGNHDKLTESIASSGLHEYEDCLVYVLNTENDFPWKQGKTSGALDKIRQASENMKTCFDSLISRGETRPIFIAGHVPLHFTARTSSRHTTGDNLYSSLIFNVVNDAAQKLDIIYFFGHNHSKGWDCYMGGSSVFKPAGSTVLIPSFSENSITTDEFTEEPLNFTYLNAGYTGYYMNCGTEELDAGTSDQYLAADNTLTSTLCAIYKDRIELIRYASEGVHPLGWTGDANPYKNNIDTGLIDEKYYAQTTDSPQIIRLK